LEKKSYIKHIWNEKIDHICSMSLDVDFCKEDYVFILRGDYVMTMTSEEKILFS